MSNANADQDITTGRITDIRRRQQATAHLANHLRLVETTDASDSEVVTYHHNEGRLVLATVPGWAEGMGEHVKHAHGDIEVLLKEVARLTELSDRYAQQLMDAKRAEMGLEPRP